MTKPIREYVPRYIRDIAPYLPGKPTEEVERELNIEAVKLASNENPLGPSPLAVEAAKQALRNSNRYPDGSGFYLRQALAKKHSLSMEQIILGAGSTELIDLAARLLLRSTDAGVTSYGSFPLYYMAIRATGARLVEIPLRDYRFDLEAMAQGLTREAKLIFLANPNNPTGTMFTADEFDEFLSRVPPHVFVVLDEAYCDYIERKDYSRSIELVRHGANLLVLRTFSKVYGLAGLRIGYGLGPAGLLEEMNKIRGPFNTSNVAQAAALRALEDRGHVQRSREANDRGLAQLAAGMKELGVDCVPSVANFILAEFGYDTQPLSEELAKQGVMVRAMRWMGFPEALRVSVGRGAENDRFLTALADLHAASAARPSPGRRQRTRKTETQPKG
ncbi:MAG TPA: histidinol-phosphate transaminase [Candidatus Cybelea sp.]|nr:histidinol-phosphate transaminase [Candidatus Cybelea sp.]